MNNKITILAIIAALFVFTGISYSQSSQPSQTNSDSKNPYLNMSLEELLDIDISIASKKAESFLSTPAAVYVVTAEDIRRSGATSLPEVLRMVPGLNVVRMSSNVWAVSERGFLAEFSKRLLVMIDGRSIYNTHFAGVYWNENDVMLEDVEKIEVIRGPGGSVWGANAVNGVINIVTKKAKDTQGGLFTGGFGNEEKGFSSLRYGFKVGENAYMRAYGKYFNRDENKFYDGGKGPDEWEESQTGFRLDWDKTEQDSITFQGDAFHSRPGQRRSLSKLTSPYSYYLYEKVDAVGANLLSRWTHKYGDDSDFTLQMYYDTISRDEELVLDKRQTIDIDFQNRTRLTDNHEIVFGFGYKRSWDKTKGSFDYELDPDSRTLQLYSGFIEDKITLIQDKLYLTVGSKFENYTLSDFDYQPSMRLAWTVNEHSLIWASVSRALRTPSRWDVDSRTNWGTFLPYGVTPWILEGQGNPDLKSEVLYAYELGHRAMINDKLFIDVAGFYNVYDKLLTFEKGTGYLEDEPPPQHYVIPYRFDNKMKGETYGGEISGTYEVNKSWKLSAAYSFLQMQLHPYKSSNYTADSRIEGESPHNQFNVRSYLDLPGNLQWDVLMYYVDNRPGSDLNKFIRFDTRIGWQINQNTDISVVGQNLFDKQHPEYTSDVDGRGLIEIERSVYVKLTYKF